MKVHELKTQFFHDIETMKKTADLRLNDRDFQVGDLIHYREWRDEDYKGKSGYLRFTNNNLLACGDECFTRITHVVSATSPCVESKDALKEGYVILSIKKIFLSDDGNRW